MKPVLFVHIPKTAGTSLNTSAEACFGADRLEKDYGKDAPHTSELVQKSIYGEHTVDPFAFHQAFLENKKTWLTGHFSADRYLSHFGCQNTIAFVREPVERVISEYLYLQRQGRMNRSFEEFYRSPDETNKQYRMIGQFPWQAFHLVGSQERYGECVGLLGQSFGLPLTAEEKNRRTDNAHTDFNDEVREDVRRWNERDCQFYQDATEYLRARLEAEAAGTPFCFHDVGFVAGQHAIGWAFFADDNEPVNIDLYVDGLLAESARASEPRADLDLAQAPRRGCVGFRFVLAPYAAASSIELKAQPTAQSLLRWSAN